MMIHMTMMMTMTTITMMMTMMLISLFCHCSCEAWIQSTAHLHHKSHNHILISKPHTSQDWFEVATLEVNIFDDPPFPFTLTFNTSTFMKWISWKLFDHDTTIRRVYQRHVTTARRMTGMSYDIWVAKYHGTVIGMVTLGVVQTAAETTAVIAVETTETAETSSRQATVGILCVDPNSRRLGVGALLLLRVVEEHSGWKSRRSYVLWPSEPPELSGRERGTSTCLCRR